MKNLLPLALCSLCLFWATILTGCGGGSGSTGNLSTVTAPRREGNLSFALSTPKSVYKHGEDISAALTVTNTGTEPVSVYYTHDGDSELGIYGNGIISILPDGVGEDRIVTFVPGESKTYTLEYSQSTLLPENSLPTGRYQLDAWLTGSLTGFDSNLYGRTSLASGQLNIQITE